MKERGRLSLFAGLPSAPERLLVETPRLRWKGAGPRLRLPRPWPVLAVLLLLSSGCLFRQIATKSLADSLAASGAVFASEEDPELVREALPFALKTMETLLESSPRHHDLLVTTSRAFTQYAYAFVELDADFAEEEDYRRARWLRERALRLYLRGRNYGLRALELRQPGISERLRTAPEEAVAGVPPGEQEALYWTGASWGAAISLGKDRPELIADLPAVTALLRRSLDLGEGFGQGAVHEALITIESLPANMGGSIERAREHFDRAVRLSGGLRASPYVALAEEVSVRLQDRREFVNMLERALAVDPDAAPGSRLHNILVQRRARWLLDRADDLFLEALPGEEGGASHR